MVTYFPPLHSDELLYSWFARYYCHQEHISPKATVQALFGSATTSIIPDLPINLKAFHRNIHLFKPPSVESLITDHTLYTYHVAFTDSHLREKAYDIMQNGRNASSLFSTLSVNGMKVRNWEYLRFCPVCRDTDISRYGEPIWHVSHQLPKVWYCAVHGERLLDSTIRLRNPKKRFALYPATDHTAPFLPDDLVVSALTDAHLRWLSVESKKLIGFRHFLKQDELRQIYHYLLYQCGYMNACGHLNQRSFVQDFTDFYGEECLALMDSSVGTGLPRWPVAMVKGMRQSTAHPVRHLLLLHFLGSPVDELPELKGKKAEPFGPAPYYCLNPAASHYQQRAVSNLDISPDHRTRQPIGRFSCSCGYIYARKGPDSCDQDQQRKDWVICYGPLWEAKLKQLLNHRSLTYSEIADKLNCSITKIQTYSQSHPKPLKRGHSLVQKKLKAKEAEWLELIRIYPNATRTELYNLNMTLYNWLLRHHRDWLYAHAPDPIRRFSPSENRQDWGHQDLKLVKELEVTIQQLYSADKPVFVSRNRIGKEVPKITNLHRQSKKFPLTARFLEEKIETREEFQIRRIRWAYRELRRQGKIPRPSAVAALASLKGRLTPKLQKVLNEELERHEYDSRDSC